MFALATGLAAAVGFIVWQAGAARDIVRDQQVWSHGAVAEDLRVSGQETSRNFVLNSYELTATFTTRDGQPRSEKISFDAFLQSVDQDAPLDARYDTADPSRVVLSWAMDVTRGRWCAVAFLGVMGLIIAASLLMVGIRALGRLFVARRATASFEELELTVVQATTIRHNGRPTGRIKYEFLVPDDLHVAGKRTRKRSVTFNEKKETPVFLSGDGKRILGVRASASRDVPVVPRQDGYPFALSDAAREALTAAAARRSER
ncbi:MAG TPA: hypothetical protein VGD37_17045 [Kofleriaceae bacterium]